LNYAFIKSLIDLAEEYEVTTGTKSPEVASFVRWIEDGRPHGLQPLIASTDEGYSDSHIAGNISRLIVYMYRYAKLYIKKGLDNSAIQSMDEFGYMVSLLQHGPMNKTQLIQRNIQEKPTGMEIINRMLKLGLMTEKASEQDKRSKVLFVSDAGKAEMGTLFERMDKISRLISGDLSENEQLQLMSILQRLHEFHTPIFMNNLHELDKLLDSQ